MSESSPSARQILAALALLAVAATGRAQNPGPVPTLPPCAQGGASPVGCQLIAWSQMQKPIQLEPAPNPVPDRPTLVRTVVRENAKYVFKTCDTATCPPDDQEPAKQYADKNVQDAGAPDGDSMIPPRIY